MCVGASHYPSPTLSNIVAFPVVSERVNSNAHLSKPYKNHVQSKKVAGWPLPWGHMRNGQRDPKEVSFFMGPHFF